MHLDVLGLHVRVRQRSQAYGTPAPASYDSRRLRAHFARVCLCLWMGVDGCVVCVPQAGYAPPPPSYIKNSTTGSDVKAYEDYAGMVTCVAQVRAPQ